MKLIEEKKDNVINANEMKQGQIGIIREHSVREYIGSLVAAHLGNLIRIGHKDNESSESQWTNYRLETDHTFRVEILTGKHTFEI